MLRYLDPLVHPPFIPWETLMYPHGPSLTALIDSSNRRTQEKLSFAQDARTAIQQDTLADDALLDLLKEIARRLSLDTEAQDEAVPILKEAYRLGCKAADRRQIQDTSQHIMP